MGVDENETASATMDVVDLDFNPAEKNIIEYVAANPKNLKFTLLDFGAQSRVLPDLDAIVGYAESFPAARVSRNKLIIAPKSHDGFASVLTVGSSYIDTGNVQNLIKAFEDPRVQGFIATDPEVRTLALQGNPG